MLGGCDDRVTSAQDRSPALIHHRPHAERQGTMDHRHMLIRRMTMRRDSIARRKLQLDDERPAFPRVAGHYRQLSAGLAPG